MPEISTREFNQLPLRVHDFLAGVPLHDVWAIDLPRPRSGITLNDFSRAANACLLTPSPLVRALLNIRLFVGRLLGWDQEVPLNFDREVPLQNSDREDQPLKLHRKVQPLELAREPSASTASETFATRLTATDRSASLVPAGTREGFFRVVYRFENEQLLELINRTAHAAALSALVETPDAYRFYFAVYVRSVSRFTPVYMALIDPFRKLIVYPSLLRSIRATWIKIFGTS